MKFVVIGSGAIGSYFGAKLQLAGHEVVFVARGKTLRALQESGLTLRRDDQETRLPSVTVTDDVTTIGAADTVLICVKTWQLDAVMPNLPALKGADTRFLTLQNGVEAGRQVATVVGDAHTLAGLVRGFFELEAPGVVRHVGVRPTITFGSLDVRREATAERLLQTFTEADIYAELWEDVAPALWEKFLIVTSLSGVGAVTRAPIDEFYAYEPTRQMLRDVMTEIMTVGRARGIALPDDVIDRSVAFVGSFPRGATTSMQRDVMNGLPSELEAQTGAVVRLGREAGVATPISQYIYDCLILQERRARAMLSA